MNPISAPSPVFALDASSAGDFGDLPEWDLSDLYTAPDAPEVERDFVWIDKEAASFAADYEGKLATLDAEGLLASVTRNEKIGTVAGRIMSYASLRYAQNTADPDRAKFMSDAQERITAASQALVFYTLEMNRLEDAALDAHLASNADLARYRPWFEKVRALKPYQLSDELEKYLHDQSVVGATAWTMLFDETMARLEFEVGEETLNLEATLNLLSEQDRDKREAGARALADVFTRQTPLFARITNTLAKEKEVDDRWRNMPSPQAGRHISNQVEPEVVEALRNAVVAAYPKLSHRYYALKAKWMGLETMEVWDRNAPLPDEDDRLVMWESTRRVRPSHRGRCPPLCDAQLYGQAARCDDASA